MLQRPGPLPRSTFPDFLKGNDPKPIRSCERSGPVGHQTKMRSEEWCRGTELNCRHQPFQGCALPTELPRHIFVGSCSGWGVVSTGTIAKNQALRCEDLAALRIVPGLESRSVKAEQVEVLA